MQVASADSWRMRGIRDVETMEPVLDGGLLWMGGDPVLVPAWRFFGDEFTGKRELDVWVVVQIAHGQNPKCEESISPVRWAA